MIRKILVSIAKKTGLYDFAVSIDTKLVRRKQRKHFKKHGMEALIQADKAFREANSFIFLDFGTLLGAYREKDFIAYDFDLDVGYLYGSKPENMNEILEKYGFKHERQYYVGETGLIVEDMYSYKNVSVDFFAYFEKEDRMYCYLARRHETKTWQEANRTDGFPSRLSWVPSSGFSEIDFLGHRFLTPDKTPEWLRDIYGESFMSPIRNWKEENQKMQIKPHTERLFRRYY